ncbi:MAG: hypothetical protein BWK80_60000 [Desulfobacteraceae bacterium IS3]|nr:MAG: hypothetical protein BWK80_60000 [Desulfobacteraceae bacterium IS3]
MPDKPAYKKTKAQDIREELKKYRELFQNAPVGIFQSTLDGRLLNVNPAHARLFGYDSSEEFFNAVKNQIQDTYVRPEQRKILVEMALKQNCLLNFENQFIRKDGSTFTANLHVRVVRNDDGSVRYLEGFIEDITDRKNMEAALRESEARYRSIFENTGTGSIIIEEDMTISLANAEFTKLVGYSKAEIENKMKWPVLIAKDDVEKMKQYHLERRKGGGSAPNKYEFKVIDKNGNTRYIFLTIDMIAGTKRSVSSLMDITSLKQAETSLRQRESQLSAVIEAFEGFIYICSRDHRIEFMNKSLSEYTGSYTAGDLCHKVIYGLNEPCSWCADSLVFEGKTLRTEFKSPKDGKWYYAVNSPIFNADNSVLKKQAMIIDIDERKLTEEALKEREEYLLKENIRLRSNIKDRYKFGNIVGKSPAMQEVYELILRAAASDANVIVYGESGTGKELVARAIHDMSDRSKNEFVPVNCGAIPENLLESEFFGYRKGAFTGANTDKHGYLDLADHGTLFLDEIGEISLAIQVKLLRAIEGGGFTPIGGKEVKKPNVRIIAATNKDLQELVKRGAMREDFFYRIHIIPIYLPPLRERKEDIPLLVEHFLERYGDEKKLPPVTGKIAEAMRNYDWHGNVRELQNTLHRYVTLNKLDFMMKISQKPGKREAVSDFESAKTVQPLQVAAADFEKKYILSALEENQWHRTKVAGLLGINRKTLFKKMKYYGLI